MPSNGSTTPAKVEDPSESLPEAIAEKLRALRPKQVAAVRHYVDPGSPGFGNKTRAKELAGYSDGTASNVVFQHPGVKAAVEAFRDAQIEDAAAVLHHMEAMAPEALDVFVQQLRAGKGLDIVDPREIFGDRLDMPEEADTDRLREINRYNKVVLAAMSEAREAAKLIMAYAKGTPEQRMRVTREEDTQSAVEEFFEDMTKEEFEELGRVLFAGEGQVQKNAPPASEETNGADDDIVVTDVEIVEES